jgi:hypothetical protein
MFGDGNMIRARPTERSQPWMGLHSHVQLLKWRMPDPVGWIQIWSGCDKLLYGQNRSGDDTGKNVYLTALHKNRVNDI